MKKTLHLKFVLAYLVFGLLAFLAVSTAVSYTHLDVYKRQARPPRYPLS